MGPTDTAEVIVGATPLPVTRGARIRIGVAGWAAAGSLSLVVLVALAAPVLPLQDPDAVSLGQTFQAPSPAHPLGTDSLGRDLLSRLVWGARTALLGPAIAVGIATTVGATIAIAIAWRGGRVDASVSRIIDAIFAFPALLLALLVVSLAGTGLLPAAIAVAVAFTPYMVRVTRAEAARQRRLPYIEACVAQGFSGWAIAIRHLVPNVGPLVLAQATVLFGYAIIDLAAISYLGLGVQPPTPDWGSMVQAGQPFILQGRPGEVLVAGLAIVSVVVAVNVLGQQILNAYEGSDRG